MAREFVENFDPATADPNEAQHYHDCAALYYLLEEQFDEALQLDEESFAKTNNPFAGLRIALLADRLKDAEKRDAALQQIKAKGAGYLRKATGKPRLELVALAGLMADDLAHGGKGEIDLKAADKISAAASDGGEQMNCHCFLAAYLDLHGKKDEAIRYWRRCLGYTGNMHELNRTLAGAELIARGQKADVDAAAESPKSKKPQDKK